MSEELKELKASVVYAMGINRHPITRFEKLVTLKTQIGVCLPAVVTRAQIPDTIKEYDVTFPVFSVDVTSEQKLEELRASLHKRLDATFDEYKERLRKEESEAPAVK